MKLFKLNAIYDTEMGATKAPSRFLANKGKQYKEEIDSNGHCSEAALLAYAEWLKVDATETITTVKSDLFCNEYYWLTQFEGSDIDETTVNKCYMVKPEEVIDRLDVRTFVELYKLTQGNFNYDLDHRIIFAVKELVEPVWKPMNDARIAKQVEADRLTHEAKLDKDWEEQVKLGNIQVRKVFKGLSRREVEAGEYAIDPLSTMPIELEPFLTQEVIGRVQSITAELSAKREAEEAEKARKVAAMAFRVMSNAVYEEGCPFRSYGVKGLLLGHLDRISSQPEALLPMLIKKSLAMDVNNSFQLTLDLLDQFVVPEAVKVALEYTGDKEDDPMFAVDEAAEHYSWVVNPSNYAITQPIYESSISNAEAVLEEVMDVESTATKQKSIVDQIEEIVGESGGLVMFRSQKNAGGEYMATCNSKDTRHVCYEKDLEKVLAKVQEWKSLHQVEWAVEADKSHADRLKHNAKLGRMNRG